jgi:hypothetical protein
MPQLTGRAQSFGTAQALVNDETIEGHLFFHLGDDSTFRAQPFTLARRADRS